MTEIAALIIILVLGIPFVVCTVSLALYVVACIVTLSLDEPPFRRQALGYAAGFVLLAFSYPMGRSRNCRVVARSKLKDANKPLVPTRNGEAPLLAAQRRRWAGLSEE